MWSLFVFLDSVVVSFAAVRESESTPTHTGHIFKKKIEKMHKIRKRVALTKSLRKKETTTEFFAFFFVKLPLFGNI